MELIDGDVMVELVDIGEGFHGEYNPLDPDDQPLLRFYIYERDLDGMWVPVEDASYCTQLNANLSLADQIQIARTIMGRVKPLIEAGESVKRECEDLSWLAS
jgi:hypothetical protein